ncbi:MAG: sodium-dependent transporter [Planctomycetota bacterium]|jgi:NSS family neurotransmitter:Na+ symporter
MAAGRERWASRPAFIMAAVGSAIGLGNVWRFPGTAFNYGGGAFFIPYFIALLTAGIPLMIVEYGIGSRFQGSAAKSYGKLGRRYEWIGWWAVLVGLVISLYYCVILAWSWVYLWDSVKALFGEALPWPKGGAEDYFQNDIQKRTGSPDSPWEFGELVWPVVLGLALTWGAVYLSIVKGVLRVGKIVMVTVPLPLILLILLAIRGLTLDGASDGLAYYLAPDWSKLLEPKTWLAAYGQVFFSLSVGWGILIAYASYMSKKTDVVNNAYITSFANCGFSFLAGFAVFSTVGFLGLTQGMPVGDIKATSFDLAFMTYPTAVENFPGGHLLQCLIAIGFFLMLLTLGVDSAFSIVEAVATAMYDKFRMTRARLVRLLCIGGFLLGLVFCLGSGHLWLDITDKFVSDYGLAVVALVQCVLIAWVIPREKLRDLMNNINSRSELRVGTFWVVCLKLITPAVLGVAIVLASIELFTEGYGGFPLPALILGGVVPVALIVVLAFCLQYMKGKGDDAA